jgi:uncharacterized protein (DUF488 family)
MTGTTIWTIGYEQATVAAVMGALQEAGVEVLADIRALPLSRRRGFSKSALRAEAEAAGIEYRHIKPLGTPAEGRAAARSGDREAMARIYDAQLHLPEAMAAVAELRALAGEKRVALLCYERDASECHRRMLIEAEMDDFTAVDLLPLEDGGLQLTI